MVGAFLTASFAATPSQVSTLQAATSHNIPMELPHLGSASTCGVIVSAWATNHEELSLLRSLMPARCRITVYDKGPGEQCAVSTIPSPMACVAADNLGNDWNPAYLTHVIANYDTLPDVLIALPSGYATHNRFTFLSSACRGLGATSDDDHFCCVRFRSIPRGGYYSERVAAHPLIHAYNTLSEFVNVTGPPRALPAVNNVSSFGAWMQKHLAIEPNDARLRSTHACHYSLFGASAGALRARPRELYAQLLALYTPSNGVPNDAYYTEWAQELIFGATSFLSMPKTK